MTEGVGFTSISSVY